MRDTLNPDWIKPLEIVTKSYNNTPIKRLGWLRPNDVTSPASSVEVDEAKKSHNVAILKEPTYNEQREKSNSYDGDLKVNDYEIGRAHV